MFRCTLLTSIAACVVAAVVGRAWNFDHQWVSVVAKRLMLSNAKTFTPTNMEQWTICVCRLCAIFTAVCGSLDVE